MRCERLGEGQRVCKATPAVALDTGDVAQIWKVNLAASFSCQ